MGGLVSAHTREMTETVLSATQCSSITWDTFTSL